MADSNPTPFDALARNEYLILNTHDEYEYPIYVNPLAIGAIIPTAIEPDNTGLWGYDIYLSNSPHVITAWCTRNPDNLFNLVSHQVRESYKYRAALDK